MFNFKDLSEINPLRLSDVSRKVYSLGTVSTTNVDIGAEREGLHTNLFHDSSGTGTGKSHETIMGFITENSGSWLRGGPANLFCMSTAGGHIRSLDFLRRPSAPVQGRVSHMPYLERFQVFEQKENGRTLLCLKDLNVVLDLCGFYLSNMTHDFCMLNENSKKTAIMKALTLAMNV